MKKQRSLSLIVFILLSTIVSAQTTSKQNTIYTEAGGYGFWGSINYERQLSKAPGFGVRAGVGFYTENGFYLTIPVGLNYLFPLKRDTYLETSLGVTWARADARFDNKIIRSRNSHFTSFTLGAFYRKNLKKDLVFRAGVLAIANNRTFLPWPGVSIGKRF